MLRTNCVLPLHHGESVQFEVVTRRIWWSNSPHNPCPCKQARGNSSLGCSCGANEKQTVRLSACCSFCFFIQHVYFSTLKLPAVGCYALHIEVHPLKGSRGETPCFFHTKRRKLKEVTYFHCISLNTSRREVNKQNRYTVIYIAAI